jgi:hypothetical protein
MVFNDSMGKKLTGSPGSEAGGTAPKKSRMRLAYPIPSRNHFASVTSFVFPFFWT